PVIALAALRRKDVGRARREAASADEVVERLRRQAEQFLDAKLPRLRLEILDQPGADALVLEAAVDADGGQLGLPCFGIEVQGGTRHRVAVDLEDEEIIDLPLNVGLAAAQQLIRLDALLDEGMDGADVLALGATDCLVLVGVDQRADALVAEDLREQPLLDTA